MAVKMGIYITSHCVILLKSASRKGISCLPLTSVLSGRLYTQPTQQLLKMKDKTSKENESLLRNLQDMGVDISKTRKREAFVLRRAVTYESALQEFLLDKGAGTQTVASIISRYPRAISHNFDTLSELWNIWKGVLDTDSAVLNVVVRSPESFFRTANIDNLKENISFFQSIGLTPKILSQLMAKAPRTFSNSVQLNKGKVLFLQELCVRLGGEEPESFVQNIITQNIYILTRSTRRIKANVDSIQSLMKLKGKELLLWLQGDGAHILSLSYTYFENNYRSAQETLQELGFSELEVSRYIYMFPKVLLMTPKIFATKVNLLLECGIDNREILNTPNILGMGLTRVESKIKVLAKYGYDFKSSGLGILNLCSSKYMSKLEKLGSAGPMEKANKS